MWFDKRLTVYHGCHEDQIGRLLPSGRNSIDLTAGRVGLDFGQGFYTTTNPGQAATWANKRQKELNHGRAAVVSWVVSRDELARLDSLAFTSYRQNGDFFPFVEHCRNGAASHGRPDPRPNFDVVYGPVVLWQFEEIEDNYFTVGDMDQISFHTPEVNRILQDPVVAYGNPRIGPVAARRAVQGIQP